MPPSHSASMDKERSSESDPVRVIDRFVGSQELEGSKWFMERFLPFNPDRYMPAKAKRGKAKSVSASSKAHLLFPPQWHKESKQTRLKVGTGYHPGPVTRPAMPPILTEEEALENRIKRQALGYQAEVIAFNYLKVSQPICLIKRFKAGRFGPSDQNTYMHTRISIQYTDFQGSWSTT